MSERWGSGYSYRKRELPPPPLIAPTPSNTRPVPAPFSVMVSVAPLAPAPAAAPELPVAPCGASCGGQDALEVDTECAAGADARGLSQPATSVDLSRRRPDGTANGCGSFDRGAPQLGSPERGGAMTTIRAAHAAPVIACAVSAA